MRERDPHRRCLQGRSCQPRISRMSRKLTIGSILYTLEDRISILIHYKLGKKKKHKIQSQLVGPNIPTQVLNNGKRKGTKFPKILFFFRADRFDADWQMSIIVIHTRERPKAVFFSPAVHLIQTKWGKMTDSCILVLVWLTVTSFFFLFFFLQINKEGWKSRT